MQKRLRRPLSSSQSPLRPSRSYLKALADALKDSLFFVGWKLVRLSLDFIGLLGLAWPPPAPPSLPFEQDSLVESLQPSCFQKSVPRFPWMHVLKGEGFVLELCLNIFKSCVFVLRDWMFCAVQIRLFLCKIVSFEGLLNVFQRLIKSLLDDVRTHLEASWRPLQDMLQFVWRRV